MSPVTVQSLGRGFMANLPVPRLVAFGFVDVPPANYRAGIVRTIATGTVRTDRATLNVRAQVGVHPRRRAPFPEGDVSFPRLVTVEAVAHGNSVEQPDLR